MCFQKFWKDIYVGLFNVIFLHLLAVVEDIHKRRQPLHAMDAIYFIQPTKEKYEDTIAVSF